MKRLIVPIGLLCGGLVLALVLAEVVFRIVHHGGPRHFRDGTPRFYYMPESSVSLQDGRYQWQRPAGTYRISVVGDSFTFAPGMQFDDAFPKRLERMLNLNDGVRKAEVLNLGTPGFSTFHEAVMIERAMSRGSDLVILEVTLNDLQEQPFSPAEVAWAHRFGPLELTGTLETVTRYWHSLRWLLERIHTARMKPAYTSYYLQLLEKPENRRQVEGALDQIALSRGKYHCPVVAVIFPLFGMPLDRSYPFRPLHRYFSQQLAARGIPTLDLFDTFAEIEPARLAAMQAADLHPGEGAHRVAAEQIYLWLVKTGVLPEELIIRKRYKQRTAVQGMPMRQPRGKKAGKREAAPTATPTVAG